MYLSIYALQFWPKNLCNALTDWSFTICQRLSANFLPLSPPFLFINPQINCQEKWFFQYLLHHPQWWWRWCSAEPIAERTFLPGTRELHAVLVQPPSRSPTLWSESNNPRKRYATRPSQLNLFSNNEMK